MDEDFELLDERSIIIDITGDSYSADQLVRRAKIEMAEEDLDSSVGVVYKRVNTPVASSIALENGYLVPLKGRYPNVLIEKGGSYEVRLVEKKEETLDLDENVLDECCSPIAGERAAETKENIRSNQSSFSKAQAGPSKPVIIVRPSILSDQQSSEKVMTNTISCSYLLKPSLPSSSIEISKANSIECLKVLQNFSDCNCSSVNQGTRDVLSTYIVYESKEKEKPFIEKIRDPEMNQAHMEFQKIQNPDPLINKLKVAKVIEEKKKRKFNKDSRSRFKRKLKKAIERIYAETDPENTRAFAQTYVFENFVGRKKEENQEDENVIPTNVENINELETEKKQTKDVENNNIESGRESLSSNQVVISQESLEMMESVMLTVFNDKVHLLDRILKIDGGREIYNVFRGNKEDKELKQRLTRLLGNILMEDCSSPGNPSPEEKREVISGFCKLIKRPDMEKQLSNTKNTGSLDNWVRRVRSKKSKRERLDRKAVDSVPDAKKPKTDPNSEDSQPTSSTGSHVEICQMIPVVNISQNPSPTPILFSSNNEEDWENGAAFRL
ncbi:hypothetical protein FO519_001343 [Halicephalobus sp. NKZ332]|nr:hypothetical protein FO519_001343 [Halicephalobus sp. NKZ332]